MQNIHPLFVHFPIALLSAALLFELIAMAFKKPASQTAGWWTFVLGVIAMVVTAITGLIAERSVGHTDDAHELILQHRNLEIAAGALFVLLFIWRISLKGELPGSTVLRSIYGGVFVLAMAAILTGAHVGGRLVYEFGVGTSQSPGSSHEHDSEEPKIAVPDEARKDTVKKEDAHEGHEHAH